jgi:hypothetical protein
MMYFRSTPIDTVASSRFKSPRRVEDGYAGLDVGEGDVIRRGMRVGWSWSWSLMTALSLA